MLHLFLNKTGVSYKCLTIQSDDLSVLEDGVQTAHTSMWEATVFAMIYCEAA